MPKTISKVKRPGLVQTGIRLPRDLWKRTRIAAVERGCTAQSLMAEALEKYLLTDVRRAESRKWKGVPVEMVNTAPAPDRRLGRLKMVDAADATGAHDEVVVARASAKKKGGK